MNIFVLDENLIMCAEYHCDKHVIKMILESAQMICTVLNERGIETLYKPTHKNHPCVNWLRESDANMNWLLGLTDFLNEEYMYRFDKEKNHKSFDVILDAVDKALAKDKLKFIPFFHHTPFVECMPDYCKLNNPIASYRNYYMQEKKHIAKWTKRGVPKWWKTV
jgi:hypothetical protein